MAPEEGELQVLTTRPLIFSLPLNLVWVTCPYIIRDGEFNPDGRLIDDIGEFSNLADAVLFNALSWALAGKPTALYAVNVGELLIPKKNRFYEAGNKTYSQFH